MSNVADYAEARAARASASLDLDDDLATGVGDEMAAALARAEPLDAAEAPAFEPIEVEVQSPLMAQWARFRPMFEDAMAGGLYTVADLQDEIAAGKAYFWPGQASAVVTKPVTYPSGERVMQTMWAVGDIDEVLQLAPGIEATARLIGCTSMLVEGRKGWERVLKAHGYEPWSVTVRKAL